MKQVRSKGRVWRVLLIIITIVLIVAGVAVALNAMLPGFLAMLEKGDQAQIEAYIRGFGSIGGAMLAFLMQFVQILSVFFPGGPIQIAVGVVFGTVEGFLICHIAYVLANMLVFFVARRLGSRLLGITANRQTSKLRFISEAAHPAFMVMLACLMPFLPNGLVPYIAARTKITFSSYLGAVYVGSVPCTLLLCAIGNRLVQGEYAMVALLCGLLVAGIVTLYLLRNRLYALSDRVHTFLNRTPSPEDKPKP